MNLFNGNPKTIDDITVLGLDNIAISAITVMELCQGMGNKAQMANMQKRSDTTTSSRLIQPHLHSL